MIARPDLSPYSLLFVVHCIMYKDTLKELSTLIVFLNYIQQAYCGKTYILTVDKLVLT